MARTIRVRDADYQALFDQLKFEAFSNGYSELLDYLNSWCSLGKHQNTYTGSIQDTDWIAHQIDCVDKNLPMPLLPFKTITKQARNLGVKCRGASNSNVGMMNLRDYAA